MVIHFVNCHIRSVIIFPALFFLWSTVIFANEVSARCIESDSGLMIAAASDLKFILDDLVQEFEQRSTRYGFVKVTYGSSGLLAAQLSQNAPFDLFFSANANYVEKLIHNGVARPTSKRHYAKGFLVLWVNHSSGISFGKSGINILLDKAIQKIAIANPAHAPYGKAAEIALKMTGIYNQIKYKLVYGENVAQAAQFVQAGAAQIGIISLSLAKAPLMQRQGEYWLIPQEWYEPIDQVVVITTQTKNIKCAIEFIDFIKNVQSRTILKKYGFDLPEY